MILTDILLGLSLAIDAAAISIALGIVHYHTLKWQHIIGIPACFGFFQAFMPLLGWIGGVTLLSSFNNWNSIIASCILFCIGINMLRNSRRTDDDTSPKKISISIILALATASSIDALATGFALPELSSEPIYSILRIGIITFLLCFISIRAARYMPKKYTNPAECAAGFVLIALGIKMILS